VVPLSVPLKDETSGPWIVRFNPAIDSLPPESEWRRSTETPVAILSLISRDAPSIQLPPHAVVGWFSEYPKRKEPTAEYHIEPENFTENPTFRDILQQLMRKYVTQCPEIQSLAKTVRQGPLPVCDERSHLPLHRMPTVDILGIVFVKNGEVVPDSYEPNPAFRLVTSHDGLFKLLPSLREKLLQAITNNK
jgi:hypothetical protein